MDKDLGAARKARWAKAFTDDSTVVSSSGNIGEDQTDYINRKATIVMEHLIQASDVSHTMQVRLVAVFTCLFVSRVYSVVSDCLFSF
jgi:hypothetical protein